MLTQKIYSLISIPFLITTIAKAQYQPNYSQLPEKTKAKYNYLTPNHENLIPAFVDSLCAWALLDSAGNELLMPRYSELQLHGHGLVSATRAGRQSFWLHKAPKLIPLQYENVTWWAEQLLLVSANQQKGIINTAGTGIIPTMYDEIVALPQSILARRGKTWLQFDPKNGTPRPLNPQAYISPQAEANSQYARQFPKQIHAITWKDNNKYQLIKTNNDNPNTQILIPPQIYPIHYTNGQFAFLEIQAVFYPYDLNTQNQKNIRYDKIIALNAQGLWAVGQTTMQADKPMTKWGIIDDKGTTLVDIQYDSLIIDKQFHTLIHLAQTTIINNNSLSKWGLWETNNQTWLANLNSQQKTVALAPNIWATPDPEATTQNPNLLYLWQKDTKGHQQKLKTFENIAFENVRYLSPQYFAAKETNKETKDKNWQLYSLEANPKNPAKNLLTQPYADIRSQKNQLFEVSSDGKSYFFINLQGKKPACP